jgi:hypothetical protein
MPGLGRAPAVSIAGSHPKRRPGATPTRLVRRGKRCSVLRDSWRETPARSPRWTLKTALGQASPISYGGRFGAPHQMSRGAPRVEAELGRQHDWASR